MYQDTRACRITHVCCRRWRSTHSFLPRPVRHPLPSAASEAARDRAEAAPASGVTCRPSCDVGSDTAGSSRCGISTATLARRRRKGGRWLPRVARGRVGRRSLVGRTRRTTARVKRPEIPQVLQQRGRYGYYIFVQIKLT